MQDHKQLKILPQMKPYLFISGLKYESAVMRGGLLRRDICKSLKTQNKHLIDLNFSFQGFSEGSNKTLLKFCEKYARNLHWIKHLNVQKTFQNALPQQSPIKKILRLRKCLQAAQSLSHLEISRSTASQTIILAPLFKDLKKLEAISLNLCPLAENVTLEKFFFSLRALQRLKKINLSFDNIPFKELNAGLRCLKTLHCIELRLDGLSLDDESSFLFDFRALKSLSALTLSSINPFTVALKMNPFFWTSKL